MIGMIFNVTNLLILIIVAMICYTFWQPYIRGKKRTAVVDGYCHPKDEQDSKNVVWCCRLMYRESKGGKRLYCCTRSTYDTREELRTKFPKGAEVEIRCYDNGRDEPVAVILSDKEYFRQQMMYSLAALLGGIGVAVGYQLLLHYTGV